jgi:anti-anti-sigma factor
VVTLPAEVDVATAGDIRHQLLSVINQGASALVVDMTATTFCDSSCVNAVVRAYHRAVAAGTPMRLVCAWPGVRRVFEITEIDRLIPVYPSVDEALSGQPSPANGAAKRA